jgi:hypothetical protein
MPGRLEADSHKKRAGNGPVHSPVSGPIKTKDKKQTNKSNQKQTTNNNQGKVGQLPAVGDYAHDDILCAIL